MIQPYRVRGLTCWRCMLSVIDDFRQAPGVEGIQVDLVPFGESRVSVDPEGALTRDEVRGRLGRAGFELVDAPAELHVVDDPRPRSRDLSGRAP